MKVIRGISHVFVWICMALVAAMMLLMVADVVARVVFQHPITGATEWVQILLVSNMTALGAAVLSGRMVKVDMLTSKMKPKTQVILEIITLAISMGIIILIAWQQFVYAFKCADNRVQWTTIKVDQWPFVALFGLSYAVAALTILATIIRKIVSGSKGLWEEEAKCEEGDPVFMFGRNGWDIIKKMVSGGKESDNSDDRKEDGNE